ncbi:MAG: hypothetical protein QOF14_5417 [Hyphomicrobiales bacterium]|jgi:integrase|nr:hypothetical protein [Hyphomicrobiales bacterium]
MPRKVRDSNLETRTARARLKNAVKPYFRLIEPGLHLGYRKLTSGPGTWIARRYGGHGKYRVENLKTPDGRLVFADDFSDADGDRVLTFGQAQEAIKATRPSAAGVIPTVADVLDEYLRFLEGDGRSASAIADARNRAEVFIRPKLGAIEIPALTTKELRKWRDDLARSAPRVRTRPGEKQKYREVTGEDDRRARQASANRTWTVLRAALNLAYREDEGILSDKAWRAVKPFRGVDRARQRYLSIEESKRLINASDPTLRSLVQAALVTGARYGQLAQLRVSDFDPDAGMIGTKTRKGDGSYRYYGIVLSEEGVQFFRALTAGRPHDALVMPGPTGLSGGDGRTRTTQEWSKNDQVRPLELACERARITPGVGMNTLRHTWASHSVMRGVPLMIVAKNMGHTDTRMVEKHYGHLAPSYIADAIRAGAPRFDIHPNNVTALA